MFTFRVAAIGPLSQTQWRKKLRQKVLRSWCFLVLTALTIFINIKKNKGNWGAWTEGELRQWGASLPVVFTWYVYITGRCFWHFWQTGRSVLGSSCFQQTFHATYSINLLVKIKYINYNTWLKGPRNIFFWSLKNAWKEWSACRIYYWKNFLKRRTSTRWRYYKRNVYLSHFPSTLSISKEWGGTGGRVLPMALRFIHTWAGAAECEHTVGSPGSARFLSKFGTQISN